jgi:SAM-dependent methyltransferase
VVNPDTSRYVEKKNGAAKAPARGELVFHAAPGHLGTGFDTGAEWLRHATRDYPKSVAFLTGPCGVEFRGRVLEIGATGGGLSAELSKLPKVVEVTATDFTPKLLREEAPKLFRLLNAHEAKITRMPMPAARLDFPDRHFDFIVTAALLHRALNMVTLLREIHRLLKPGGTLVALREPVLPWVKWKPAARRKAKPALPGRTYTLADYLEFFALAGLELQTRRLNLSEGFKYYFDKMVNGLTHARYVFIARRVGRP